MLHKKYLIFLNLFIFLIYNMNKYNLDNQVSTNGYALHAVLINKQMGFEAAENKAREFIKKPHFFHRETANEYRFRNIPKTKFEKRTFRSKKINPDVTLVFAKLKPENLHLEGEGLGDWFRGVKEKAKRGIEKVKDFFKPRLDDYNNTSKKTLLNYGNQEIESLYIHRTPIMSILNKVLNLITLGKFDEAKRKYKYDDMYHLALVAEVSHRKIIIEKNEVVNVSTAFKHSEKTVILNVPLHGKKITLYNLLDNTRKAVGDTMYFKYAPFNQNGGTNCQLFIKLILEKNGLLTQEAKNFLYQDIEEFTKEIPEVSRDIAQTVTDIGAVVNKLTGQGLKKKKDNKKVDAYIKKKIREVLKELEKEII